MTKKKKKHAIETSLPLLIDALSLLNAAPLTETITELERHAEKMEEGSEGRIKSDELVRMFRAAEDFRLTARDILLASDPSIGDPMKAANDRQAVLDFTKKKDES